MELSRCDIAQSSVLDAPESNPDAVAPPLGRVQRERRMQVRAYSQWANLLEGRRFPSVADLSRGGMLDFCEHSLLLELSETAEDPAVAYIGERLAGECDAQPTMRCRLGKAPADSLLQHLAGRYHEVIASRSPAGFEAEILGDGGNVRLYRGILLPFSGNDQMIDHVLAVINWKEHAAAEHPQRRAATQATAPERARPLFSGAQLTDWADGPGGDLAPQSSPSSAGIPNLLSDHLRALPGLPFDSLSPTGCEFSLVLVRRDGIGPIELIGEVHEAAMIEEAANHLLR